MKDTMNINGDGGNKPRNFVHVHMMNFNKAVTMDDRKRKSKNGHRKHKGKNYGECH